MIGNKGRLALLALCVTLTPLACLRAEEIDSDEALLSYLDEQIETLESPTLSEGDIQFALEVDPASCNLPKSNGSCSQCKKKKKKKKASPGAKSHKPLFYDNDFSYLNDPSFRGHYLGDSLKLNPVGARGKWGTMDVGGQLRVRYHHELGMGQDLAGAGTRRFEDTEQNFVLTRLRLFNNWQVNDSLRIYAEGIFADASDDGGTYRPRGIDRNYGDFLNLFADLKLTDSLTLRVGRQELLFGAERVVSPLDWANTRRTFEGARVMWKEGDWNVDSFYTHFVPVDPNDIDEADYNQAFYGTHVTYSGWENAGMDVYYLGYDNNNALPGAPRSDFSIHTLGLRLNGSVDNWLWEFEGGPQFGRQSGLGLAHEATFATAGIGRKLSNNSWKPTLWFYYDYASGNNEGGDFNRFNQLFPLAHKYFGFIDAVQRSNVEAPNLLLTMSPTKRVQLLVWYWHFMANQENDIVPSIGGQPTQSLNSKDLGDELDLICKIRLGARSNCLIGYSHFWRGSKLTGPEDADFTYIQWTSNF